MELKEKIAADLKRDLKEKRDLAVSVLRQLLAAILNKEKEKRIKLFKEKEDIKEDELIKESQLTDNEIIEVVFSESKKRKEAVLGFEKGGRESLAEKEKKELEILKKYLPEQLPEEEIKRLAKEVIERTGAVSPQDIGKVMGKLIPQVKGRAEGSMVGKIVKELLT